MEDKHKSVCLSVDIGSSSIRCTNFVRTIPEGVHCTYPHCNTKCVGKFAEKVNNVEMILRIVHEVVSKCMVALKREGVLHISSIGFASFCMNLVGLDQDHTICTPLITYATSMPQILPGSCSCVGGYNVMDDREYHSNTGAILDHPSYALVHLKNMPTPLLKKVCYWQSISSLMIGRWTNTKKVPMSYSEASWTGLFNFRTLQWDEKALISCGLSCNGALPPVIDFDEFTYNADVCSVVSWDLPLLPGYEKESSLNVARRYYLAVGDGAAATIGSAGVLTRCIDGTKPSMPLCLTVGTSAAVRTILPRAVLLTTEKEAIHPSSSSTSFPPDGIFCYVVDRHTLLLGGALSDGGSLIDWWRGIVDAPVSMCSACDKVTHNDSTVDRILRTLNDSVGEAISPTTNTPIGSDHALPAVLPFWSGERAIGYHVNAKGTVTNITLQTTSEDLVIATMDGIAHRLAVIVTALVQCCDQLQGTHSNNLTLDQQYHLLGSGAALENNPFWCQLIANSSRLPISVSSSTDLSRGQHTIKIMQSTPENSSMVWRELTVLKEACVNVLLCLCRLFLLLITVSDHSAGGVVDRTGASEDDVGKVTDVYTSGETTSLGVAVMMLVLSNRDQPHTPNTFPYIAPHPARIYDPIPMSEDFHHRYDEQQSVYKTMFC